MNKILILRTVIDGFTKQQAFGNKEVPGYFVDPNNGNRCAQGMLIPEDIYCDVMEVSEFRSHDRWNMWKKVLDMYDINTFITYTDTIAFSNNEDSKFLKLLYNIHTKSTLFEDMMNQYNSLLMKEEIK